MGSEGKSSGPSSDDPGIGGAFGGGGPSSAPIYDASNAASSAGASPSAGTIGDFLFGAPNSMGGNTQFNVGGAFGASDGSGSFGQGGASGGTPSPVTASLGSPQGVTTPSFTGGTSAAAPPTSFGELPDFTSQFDSFAAQPGASATGGAQGTALSPEQLGQPSAAPAAGGAAASKSGGSVLESLGIKNPLGTAIAAGGLAYSLSQGQQQQKYSPELLAQAQSLNAQGQQLLSYLNSGTLPAGLQASLTQATSAAKAKVISNFASQGLNTDPTQNTALAAQLAQIDQQALISTAQIGQQLMQSGIAETGLSSDLYKTLANIDQTQTANIGKAIANFASSLGGGGGGGINLKFG